MVHMSQNIDCGSTLSKAPDEPGPSIERQSKRMDPCGFDDLEKPYSTYQVAYTIYFHLLFLP